MQELLGIGPCRPQVPLSRPRLPHFLPQPHPCHAPVPQPTCPGGGNLKAAPGCCSSSPPHCANCDGPTLRLTGIVSPAPHRPLSGVPPLPKGLFPRRPLATRWRRPPMVMTARPPLHPPALCSRRSRWLLQEPDAQRYLRPL